MAVSEKSKKNLKPPYPKGFSGNPAGKPKGLLTKNKISGVIGKFADMTLAELKAVVESPDSTVLEVAVASMLSRTANTGDSDYARLNFLFDRSVGKVKEELEVAAVQPFLLRKRDGEVIEMGLEQKVLPPKKEEE